MNPYLTEENQPTETLQYTLAYYGITIDELKAMTDEQVIAMVKRFNDVLNDGRTTKSTGRATDIQSNGLYGKFGNYSDIKDSGSFSRYFDLDKWFEKKLKELPLSVQKTFPFLLVSKASKSEKNKGCEDLPIQNKPDNYILPKVICAICGCKTWQSEGLACGHKEYTYEAKDHSLSSKNNLGGEVRNNHPTVKPLKLMSYLVTLGSREGDLVLDPFMGSGTTALACLALNRHFIGSELNKDYYEIAVKRIKNARRLI